MIYAVHESGIAELEYETLKQSKDIRLQAWGAIDGRVLWGDRPGANEDLFLSIMREAHGYPEVCSVFLSFKSDGQGRFHVDRLPPWPVQISRSFELPKNGGIYSFPHLHADVAPGEPTKIVFGGPGRTVVGRLVGRDSFKGFTISITPNTPRPGDRLAMAGHATIRGSEIGPLFFRESLPVAHDGTFRIEKVIPEWYQVFVRSADGGVYQVHRLRVEAAPDGRPEEPQRMEEIRVAR